MKKIRYGIVSTATIVARFVEGIRQSDFGEVVAIAGRNLQKAEALAEKLEIPKAYGNYEAIYQDEEVDIIYIANYNGGHYQCILEALNHSKHVLCEKPMCMTPAQVAEVFQLAKEKQVFLMEAQKSVFLPAITEAKQILDKNELGEIMWINIISSHVGAKRGEWFKRLENGGGILRGAGTYPLEFLLTTFQKEPQNVSGIITRKPPISDDSCVINFSMEKILVSILITKDIQEPSRIEIHGEHGKLVIPNYWKTDRFEMTIDGKITEKVFPMNSEFVYEINHVNQCLFEKKLTSDVMKPEVSYSAIKLIDGLYCSELGDVV